MRERALMESRAELQKKLYESTIKPQVRFCLSGWCASPPPALPSKNPQIDRYPPACLPVSASRWWVSTARPHAHLC